MPILGTIASGISGNLAPLDGTVIAVMSGTGVIARSWTGASGVGSTIGSVTGSINGGASPGSQAFRKGTGVKNTAVAITNGADISGQGLYGFAFDMATGFGSQYSAPTRPTSRTGDPFWTSDGSMVAVRTDGGDIAFAYPFTTGGGWGSRISATVFSSGQDRSGSLAPNDAAFAAASGSVRACSFSVPSGFGSLFSGAPSLGGFWSTTLFSPNSNVINSAREEGGVLNRSWAFSTSTGWGSQYSTPNQTGLSGSTSDGSAWHPSQTTITTTIRDGSPYLATWAWTDGSGYGTLYSSPSPTPTSSGGSAFYSASGAVVGMSGGGGTTPNMWPFSTTTGYGTKYSHSLTGGVVAWSRT